MPHLPRIDTLEGGTARMNENFKTDEDLKRKLDGYGHIYLIYDRGSEKRETQYLEAAEGRLRRCGLEYNVVDTDMLASCIYESGRDPNEYFTY